MTTSNLETKKSGTLEVGIRRRYRHLRASTPGRTAVVRIVAGELAHVAVSEVDRVEFIVVAVIAVIDDMVAIGRVGRLAGAFSVVGDLDWLVEDSRGFTKEDLIDLVVPPSGGTREGYPLAVG